MLDMNSRKDQENIISAPLKFAIFRIFWKGGRLNWNQYCSENYALSRNQQINECKTVENFFWKLEKCCKDIDVLIFILCAEVYTVYLSTDTYYKYIL